MNHIRHQAELSSHRRAQSPQWAVIAVLLLVIITTACTSPGTNTAAPTQGQNIPSATFPGGTLEPTGTMAFTPSQTTPPSEYITSTPSSTAVTFTQTPLPSPTSAAPMVFAAIGDYGTGNKDEASVANLVLSWKPDFIITLGDNNYPSGTARHMDDAVGQFYHSFIYPYNGKYGTGSDVNRFFPTLGNHDVVTENGKPYLDFFNLPGNERYYDFTWGPVHLFALDDIETEPDGVGVSSKQAAWLKEALASSTSAWNIVYMHYPPYSSGRHGSTDWARWPYAEWGANAVLAGHDHTYERLEEGGMMYFVNGLGGAGIYNFREGLPGSLVRYNSDYGAMRITATETSLLFEFINVKGEVIDSYEMRK